MTFLPLVLCALAGLGAALFTNCSSAHIEYAKVMASSLPSIKGHLCINPLNDGKVRQLNAFSVVNVTAAFKGGNLRPDSDADGIADEDEQSLGYDPLNRRTDGKRLDNICRGLGGIDKCHALDAISCSTNTNAMGLSECDIKALNLQLVFAHPDQGIDSDKDGIPDFVEITRGTDPARNDTGDDPDGDGRSNQVEFASGTDPRSADDGTKPTQAVDFYRDDIDQCPSGAFQFSINDLILVATRAFTDSDTPAKQPTDNQGQLNFTHGDGENLILITYKSIPVGDSETHAQVWGVVLKLTVGAGNKLEVQPSDFRLLGTILK